MSSIELIASVVVTFLWYLVKYVFLPIVCTAVAILLIVVSFAAILVVKNRYKSPDWFPRWPEDSKPVKRTKL